MKSTDFAKEYNFKLRTLQYYLKTFTDDLEKRRLIQATNKNGIRKRYKIINPGRLNLVLRERIKQKDLQD